MPRPSKHRIYTKSYAIDQIEDVEQLRQVAHRMWEAFSACHAQSAHIIGALHYGQCWRCKDCFDGNREDCCAQYQEWQRKVSDGFGSV